MKFTEVKDQKIIKNVIERKRRSCLRSMVEEFIATGFTVAEIDNSGYSCPSCCTASVKTCIKNSRIGGVDVCTIGGKTYIFRTDIK